jgi:hypothetical protein
MNDEIPKSMRHIFDYMDQLTWGTSEMPPAASQQELLDAVHNELTLVGQPSPRRVK